MPVIRISDPTWDRLKHWAVPLEDGPDDAIQKALDMADEHLKCRQQTPPHTAMVKDNGVEPLKKVPRGAKVPVQWYEAPILEVLFELEGTGRVDEVLRRVEQNMKGLLGEVDYQPLNSGVDVRWRNTANWARYGLVRRGLLKADSERGVWELTELGIKAVEGKGA
jgi:hypothetical protein